MAKEKKQNRQEVSTITESRVIAERKSPKFKWFTAMLAGVMLGMGIMLPVAVGFKMGSFEADLKIEKPSKEENPDNFLFNHGGMVTGEIQGNGIQLMSAPIAPANYDEYGISPMAETAYTLTATITPAEATDKTVDWSVEFANPASIWAQGKTVTDYVTVTPTADGALTANVACLQAFGEKVNVKVICRDNIKVTATCVAEYEKKLVDVKVTLNGVTSSINSGSISFTGDPSQKYPITVMPVYTVYTLDKAYDMLIPRQELVVFPSALSSALSDEYYDIRRDFGNYNTNTEFSVFGFCMGEINGYIYTDGSDYNCAVNYYKTHARDASMKINVINKANSKVVGFLIVDLTNASFKIAVSNVTLGDSTVIF